MYNFQALSKAKKLAYCAPSNASHPRSLKRRSCIYFKDLFGFQVRDWTIPEKSDRFGTHRGQKPVPGGGNQVEFLGIFTFFIGCIFGKILAH